MENHGVQGTVEIVLMPSCDDPLKLLFRNFVMRALSLSHFTLINIVNKHFNKSIDQMIRRIDIFILNLDPLFLYYF